MVEDKVTAMSEQWGSLGAPIYARGYVDAYALVGIPKDVWQPLLSKVDYFKQNIVSAPLTRKPIAIDENAVYFFLIRNS